MTIDIHPIKSYAIVLSNGEIFTVINRLPNMYELYEEVAAAEHHHLGSFDSFDGCIEYIRDYTKYDW